MTGSKAAPPAPRPAGKTGRRPTDETGLRAQLTQCRLLLAAWPGRLIMIATLLAGVLGAAPAGSHPGGRTFAAFCGPVQSLISVIVPFLGVLFVHALRRPATARTLVPPVLATLAAAVAAAVFGVALCVLVTVVTTSPTVSGRWALAETVILGSLLVQAVAGLTGTALGLLVRRPVVAGLLTIMLPLGLWLLLGAGALHPVQAWLTPYAAARHLLAGRMSLINWAQWAVMATIWVFGLNLAGFRRASRASLATPGTAPR
jgi:hypothetical protein